MPGVQESQLPGGGVRGGCESLCEFWEPNPGASAGAAGSLTADASLQAGCFFFLGKNLLHTKMLGGISFDC